MSTFQKHELQPWGTLKRNKEKTCCISNFLTVESPPSWHAVPNGYDGTHQFMLLNLTCCKLPSAGGKSPGPALNICWEMWWLGSAAS